MSLAANLTGSLITGAGLYDQLDRYDEMKDQMEAGTTALSDKLQQDSAFTGFTVGSQFGDSTVGSDGSVNVNLNPTQAKMGADLTQYAGGLFASAAGDQGQREADMYEKIRATQRPEEERQYSALEGRLLAQGRLGAGSSAYGSSPEMFGFNKAVGESMNNASLQAVEQARMQQMQDANIGTQFQSNAFLPTAQMANLTNMGFNGAQMSQAGQLAGTNYASQLGSEALRGGLGAERVRADIMMGLFNTAGAAASNNKFDPAKDLVGWGYDKLFGEGGLFG